MGRYLTDCVALEKSEGYSQFIADKKDDQLQVYEVFFSRKDCSFNSMTSALAVDYLLADADKGVGAFLGYRKTSFDLTFDVVVQVVFEAQLVIIDGVVLKKQRY